MTTNTPDPLLDDPEPPKPRAPGTSSHASDEDKLVEQIAKQDESDAIDDLYEQESEPEEPMLVTGEQKHKFLAKLKRPKFWILLFLLMLTVAIFVWLVTPSRLWLLNTVGLRARVDIATMVAAEGTQPLLKNATVKVNGREYHTDDTGKLVLALPYGPLTVEVSKLGYETITKNQTLDFDPFFHYLGGAQVDAAVTHQVFAMKNVGLQVGFMARDWLTGSPVTTGAFSVGDVVASPNGEGKVLLTLPALDTNTAKVTATFNGAYNDTTFDVPVGSATHEVQCVPAGKDYFMSKRSGQFAVYSSNLDSSATTEIIPAAAAETGDITFSVSPSGKYGVLGSTREATRDSFGSVQQKLYVVDLATNRLTAVDSALTFRLVDWADDTLVYTALQRNTSGAAEQRLVSIDTAAVKKVQLSTNAGFRLVRVRLGSVLYQLANNELRTVKIKGGNDKSLGTGIQKVTQQSANIFAYQITDGSWHTYDVNADQLATTATPANPNRAFLAGLSRDGQTQLAVDSLDGKPALIAKAVGNGQETPLYTGADLAAPIRFVGNVVLYRAGTADYVISTKGGTAKKVADTSPTINPNDYFTFY